MEQFEATKENDIAVLREMVRISEDRRSEQLKMLERVNKYNLALIAFSGSFLSLLVTTQFPRQAVGYSGFFLLLSIFLSIFSIRPSIIKGGTITIDTDVQTFQNGGSFSLREYLLAVAELTDVAATNIGKYAQNKKLYTLFAALSLAIALIITYAIYINATPR